MNFQTVQLKKIKEIAERNGWKFIEEPSTKYCAKLLTNSKTYLMIGAELGINSSGANRVCNDKTFTDYFLNLENIKTIPTKTLYQNSTTENDISFPVIVKPNTGWGGKGVSLAFNHDELKNSIKIAEQYSEVVLIQKYINLKEYRILVFNGEVYLTYQRKLPEITGDGISDIRTLIQQLITAKRAKIDLQDPRITMRLAQLNLSLDTILQAGETFNLYYNANLSSGASWIDKTNECSEYYKKLAIKAAETLGLVIAGIDLFCNDISSNDDDNYYVIEINSSPGLQYLNNSPGLTDKFFEDLEKYFIMRG